jgi:predicted Zn-dependent protease with MMP-like domain
VERTDVVQRRAFPGRDLELGVGERNRARRERFESLVVEALDSLPGWVHERLENVEVIVEERPPPGEPNLLGRYEGVPITARDGGYTFVLPDRITLFRSTLEAGSPDDERLRERVRHTVVHEIAHYFGISDERLRDIDRY